MAEPLLTDPSRSLEVFLRLMGVYAGFLAAGFALKRLAGPVSARRIAPRPSAPADPAKTGPGIARKFKVFFAFQALMLSLSFWWLPGLGLFFLAILLAAGFEIHALGKTAGKRPGYPFRPAIAWGLIALLGLSLLSFPAFAAAVSRPGYPALAKGAPLLALIFLLVAVCDGYSQIWGEILRGRKMVPGISPGKTWSGFFGGLAMGMAAAMLSQKCIYPWLSLPAAAIAGAGVGTLAFLGDITASAVKRRLGVKDFSNLLGPQGGVLDRADSLLWLGPVSWAVGAASDFLPGFLPLTPLLPRP